MADPTLDERALRRDFAWWWGSVAYFHLVLYNQIACPTDGCAVCKKGGDNDGN